MHYQKTNNINLKESQMTVADASGQSIAVSSSRYNTEEKRKKHAEYQKKWRDANPEKIKLIGRKTRQNELVDPVRSEKRKKRLKANRKLPKTLKLRQTQKNRRYQKTANALRGHCRWSDYEIEMAFNRELTDTQISSELGRSAQAVALARQRYADRAPIGWHPKTDRKP
jgi:hypothetical protein